MPCSDSDLESPGRAAARRRPLSLARRRHWQAADRPESGSSCGPAPGLARPGRGCAWGGRWEGGWGRQGVTLLQYMRDAGVTPDAVAYTALIGLLAKVP